MNNSLSEVSIIRHTNGLYSLAQSVPKTAEDVYSYTLRFVSEETRKRVEDTLNSQELLKSLYRGANI